MSAYLIYDADIHAPEPYGEFMKQVTPLVESMAGNTLRAAAVCQ